MSGDVVVVGSANVDLVVSVARHPGRGETVLGGDLRRSPGGKGANQAVAAARAGARTALLGALGRDDAADLLLGSLSAAGVDTGLVARTPSPTGTAFISVCADRENSIIVAPGANAELALDDRALARAAAADVLLAQLEIPLESVLAAARARRPGARFVLNAAPSRPLPGELEAEVDLLVVNEHEALDLASGTHVATAVEELLQRVPAVVVTLGAQGCLLAERGAAPVTVPAPRVEPVDTTGAGDTFCGVLAAGLAEGQSLLAAARRASAAAALAVTRPGAQDAVPTAEETDELARATYGVEPAEPAR